MNLRFIRISNPDHRDASGPTADDGS
jgi:hypothetical protein